MRNTNPLPALLGTTKQMCQHQVAYSRESICLNRLKLPPQTSVVKEGWVESCPPLFFPPSPLFQFNQVQTSLEFKIVYFHKKYSCCGIGPIYSRVLEGFYWLDTVRFF